MAFEEKAFLSADRLTVWRTNSAVMMLARQSILALCQERCCFKMSENPSGIWHGVRRRKTCTLLCFSAGFVFLSCMKMAGKSPSGSLLLCVYWAEPAQ